MCSFYESILGGHWKYNIFISKPLFPHHWFPVIFFFGGGGFFATLLQNLLYWSCALIFVLIIKIVPFWCLRLNMYYLCKVMLFWWLRCCWINEKLATILSTIFLDYFTLTVIFCLYKMIFLLFMAKSSFRLFWWLRCCWIDKELSPT